MLEVRAQNMAAMEQLPEGAHPIHLQCVLPQNLQGIFIPQKYNMHCWMLIFLPHVRSKPDTEVSQLTIVLL